MDILAVYWNKTPAPIVFGLACLPMITVHYCSLYDFIMTDRWRKFMRMSFPVALVVAAPAMLLLEHGALYAGAIVSPYIQWHITRALYDWHVGKAGRPPRTYGKRLLEGDTDDERTFGLACGMGVVVLPISIFGVVELLMR
jgi:hypothetical protein